MESIELLLQQAKTASRSLQAIDDGSKTAILHDLGIELLNHASTILAENARDLERMPNTDPKKDRLMLNLSRIGGLVQSLDDISALPDPANIILSEQTMPNGLFIQKKTVALGVVGVIYESRPNVTIDVAALCIRSGNVCVLRGGSDALHTNICLVNIIRTVLKSHNIDENTVQLLPTDRKFIAEMLAAKKYIDIIIPRGSQQLIEYVRENSLVPTIETGAGVCHTYVEKTAKLNDAARIVVNAKVSRPSVCNALDTVLVDYNVADAFLELAAPGLEEFEVEIFADEQSHSILKKLGYPYLEKATPEDFGREFLDFKCSVKVVHDSDEAFAHISQYSSRHSEAIISEDPVICERFLNETDAAAVYVNASTRFTDGGVFGLGAEIGISTQKLHARGPFALEKLVTEKWIVKGNGQVR